jgi:hypothetical protein
MICLLAEMGFVLHLAIALFMNEGIQ